MKFTISYSVQAAKHLLFVLIAIEAVLVVAYVLTHMTDSLLSIKLLRNMFDLDGDLSIPAWFSSMQLFVISLLLFLLSVQEKSIPIPTSFFVVGGGVFLFLSLDEGVAIHEKVTILAKRFSFDWMMFRGNHGAWIGSYTLIAVPALWLAIPHLKKMWENYRYAVQMGLVGVAVFVTGAVGLEIASYMFLRESPNTTLYMIEVIFEEFFEMSGVTLMLYAVLLLAHDMCTSQEKASPVYATEEN